MLKPETHQAILYADRSDWRNSFCVSPTAIANFADRSDWRIKSSISSMSDTSEFRLRILQAIKFAAVQFSDDTMLDELLYGS